jgi:Arc/MetJ-type ribon-helix-helix transcriptional regulator
MRETFVSALDQALEPLGYSDRAEFIREAVYEALATRGVTLPAGIATAPSRAGKGGRPRKATVRRQELVDEIAKDHG